MTWRRVLAVLLLACFTSSTQAGFIFGKKTPKPEPALRVPQLLGILKSDPDEHKRSDAAEELREFDAQTFPDIIPVLVDALQNDPKVSVRVEAAQSLAKIRPVSQQAGQALEHSLANDPSMRVRLQARSSLLQYHWAGYRSPRKETPPLQTQEPPLAPGEEGTPPASSQNPPVLKEPRKLPQPTPVPTATPKSQGVRGILGSWFGNSSRHSTPTPPRSTAEPPLLPPQGTEKGDKGPDLGSPY